jgi:hypothetical protein
VKSIIFAVALALGLLAQTPRALAQSAGCTAALNDSCLSQMLTGLGYEPKPLSKGFLIVKKVDGWTLSMQVVISGDATKIGMNANLGLVTDTEVSAAQWEALMVANGEIDPSSFYYDDTQKKLYLHRSIDNRYVTPASLGGQIDNFMGNVRSTSKLWAFTH